MTRKYDKLSKPELLQRLKALEDSARGQMDMQAIIHDLHVHQEEVRVQNEQLMEMKSSLERSRDRYADLYDFAPISYITLDVNGVVSDINLTGTMLFAAERARIIGAPFVLFVEDDSRHLFMDHMRRCREQQNGHDGDGRSAAANHGGNGNSGGAAAVVTELRLRARNDRRFIAQLLTRRSMDLDGMVIFRTAVSDLTDLKRAEEEKRELAVREHNARAAAEAKDRFMAILSHELRTPLTPVLAAVSALLQRSNVSRSDKPILEMIRRNVELEARLIEDLLDVTRITRNKLQLRIEVMDMHEAVRDVLDMCAEEAHAKGLKVSSELRARKSHVKGDPARLRQVVWNLLKNAIKFTPAGGLVIVRTSNLSSNQLTLQVADTGPGIQSHLLGRLFSAFEQDEIERKQHGGLGLGLAISRALVESHQGTIKAASEGKGRGATFTVELPALAAPAAGAPVEAPPEKPAAAQRKLRILLVEDHSDTARILSKLLEGEGHAMKVATTVHDALKLAAVGELDLIISDLGLPDGSGYDLLKQIGSALPVPAIALSGYGAEADIKKSREAGFCQHITKPVDFGRLLQSIDQVMRGGGARLSSGFDNNYR